MGTTAREAGLFCKTFGPDFDHLQLLLDSFKQHNPDEMTLTISVPAADVNRFHDLFGVTNERVRLVTDESYTEGELEGLRGWHAQQLCKLRSAAIVASDHYAVVDADCYFVGDMRSSDILPRSGKRHSLYGSSLRTVMTGGNTPLVEYIKGSLAVDASFFPRDDASAQAERLSSFRHYKDLDLDTPSALERSDIPFKAFGARKWYYYQPGQVFSRGLLRNMYDFFQERGVSFRDAILISPWEYNWYGEFATFSSSDAIDYRVSPYLHFADHDGLAFAERNGITSAVIAERFPIVQMAARHLDKVSLDF